MISKAVFDLVKQKYGYWSSWAVWAEVGSSPKSNVGDLSVFDTPNICESLTAEVIFVGLNISRGAIKEPLANFHDKRTEATDFKIRYAFKNTPYWGGYMTDIIGSKNPTLIAFGRDTYGILKKNFSDQYEIVKVPHYANYSSKETYRNEVSLELGIEPN
jgi:hypothetical protein